MSRISTHVLDTARGLPAKGIAVVLEQRAEGREGGAFVELGRGHTDDDGRLKTLLPEGTALEVGTYRLTFDLASYQPDGFFPMVQITFAVREAGRHHHVPLLLSPYGYSTYRGS
ncbi:MAG: hydroxyisourate hydrolase [Deltaproteobacteria bacterium]|nr:hydroxyisourate hydrolase [Deltaproteobacteria bacterium]